MKLIKAYVRRTRLDHVVRALREAGAPGVTVSRAQGLGYGYEPFSFAFDEGEVSHANNVAKLEVVCREEQVGALIEVIAAQGCTGCAGDGILFVSPVEHALRIRTRERDTEALHP